MTNWTKKNIPDLHGKIFIVTGANSGLGYESAFALVENGATVIMACRNRARGQKAQDALKAAIPAATLHLMELDLASLKSIHHFAETFKSKYDRLDALLNNGGVMACPRSVTEDGFETQFGVNHLGHFALTGLLLDVLLKTPGSRVVTVSSRMHTSGKMAWDDLMSERHYDPWAAYKQSKLANLLFTFELNRRLEAQGATTRAVAVHPGLAATSLADNNLQGAQKYLLKILNVVMSQSAAMGALPELYAAVDSDAKPGSYVGPDRDTRGYPMAGQAAEAAYNEADARRLWEVSEQLTGVHYEALKIKMGSVGEET